MFYSPDSLKALLVGLYESSREHEEAITNRTVQVCNQPDSDTGTSETSLKGVSF